MISIEPSYLKIIVAILTQYPYTFYVFGSRAKGTAKKYSDLDLCFKDQIPTRIIAEIEEKFIESDLPFTVELVDWNQCSADFKKLIAKDLVKIE